MDEDVVTKGPRRARVSRGAVIGLLLGALGGAALTVWYYRSQPRDHEVVISGADVHRGGGRSISLFSGSRIYHQTCTEACDDVVLEIWPRNQEYRVEIMDAQGNCVLCHSIYADAAGRYRETISGRDKLSVHTKIVSPY